RGIRHSASYDADSRVLGPLAHAPAQLYSNPVFREGFAQLAKYGLSFDAWIVEPQIPDVTDLARAFPDTPIVLDHVGTPLGLGRYAGTQDERFGIWKAALAELAACPNAFVKLGGLAMPFCGFENMGPDVRPDSETLANHWRPYIETAIELFGAERAMFESNFPVDRWGADYATLWNAFKRIAQGATDTEKRHLFSGAAASFYRLKKP
ncbi:MAG: amidohydrolase family protein, partial [Alphaproteobacteria bacterium]|nr:amidohydrolase family protein [Alphaproteobacteria bacterium]